MQNLKTGCVNMPEKKHLNKTFYSNESNLLTRCYSRRLKVTVFCVAYSRTMASSDLFIYLFVHESTRVSHVVFNMSQGALV